jgi:pimeloyl-ACP methyl ester carboxylesterase
MSHNDRFAPLSVWMGSLRFSSLVALLFMCFSGFCSAQIPAVGRPVLFVHGFCETADVWNSLGTSVANFVLALPSLYPPDSINPNGGKPYQVYWDGQSVKLWPSGEDFLATTPKSARFFAIEFFAPGAFQNSNSSIDATQVAQVSVLNKAGELAAVVRAITTLTHVQDVIVIAHSLGGLDTRAYLEGQAFSPYTGHLLPYGNDIGKAITLDTPHSGAQTANWTLFLPLGAFGCPGTATVNKVELEEGSLLVTGLNTSVALAKAPNNVSIAAVRSYTSPGLYGASSPTGDDGVVTREEQSIAIVAPSVSNYYDLDNFLGTDPWPDNLVGCNFPPDEWPFHQLGCLSKQPSTLTAITGELSSFSLSGHATSITVSATLNGTSWAGSLNYSLTGYPTTGTSPFTLIGSTAPFTFFDGLGPVLPKKAPALPRTKCI